MASSSFQLAAITKLMGRVWLEEVDQETLAAFSSNAFRETYQDLGGYIPEIIDESTIDELDTEYCLLLIGPKGHISPVQSVWAENLLQSETTSSMNRFFELLPDYRPKSNLSDHLGIQLDFLGELIAQPETETSREVIELYAQKHLNWMDAFFDQIHRESESRFYSGAAVVTRNLIHSILTHP